MKFSKLVVTLAMSVITSVTYAADVTGVWNASIETPQGAVPLVFNLAAEGSALTGDISNQMMPATPIQDGVVDGNNLAWTLVMEIPNAGPLTIHYKAMIEGDQMTITSTLDPAPPGGNAETTFTATRAAP